MKANEYREQTAEELLIRLAELEEESFNLRFQHTLGQLSSPIRLREVRRDIARLRTVLAEDDSGLRPLPGAVAQATTDAGRED